MPAIRAEQDAYPLRPVRDFGDEFELVTNSQDIREVLDSCCADEDPTKYGALFVQKGDCGEVWGCFSSVPYLYSLCEFVGNKVD